MYHLDPLACEGRWIIFIMSSENDKLKHMRYLNIYNDQGFLLFDKQLNKEIGQVLINPEDIDKIKITNWRLNEKGYVTSSINRKTTKIHNLILNRDTSNPKITCDHINRNKLDNRKQNLRIISHLENNLNSDRVNKGKGYCFRRDRNKWMAYIKINNKVKTIGYYNTEEEAKEARKVFTVRISDTPVGLMSYQKSGQLLNKH